MEAIRTHTNIDNQLSGYPQELGDGYAVVKLITNERMTADETGLVHGGFIFSCADYTAMLSVNHPNVVLARAEVKFLKPVRLGDEITFKGNVDRKEGKKVFVNVKGYKGEEEVFSGVFLCVIPEKHVLEGR